MSKCLIEGELVLAVDFDGTITTEPEMGKELVLQPECKRVLTRLHEDGIRIVLWTCRSGPVLEEALEFLKENDMLDLFCAINDQLEEINTKYAPHVARKVGADIYIDDKSLGFVVDWEEIENGIYGQYWRDM